MDYAEKIRRLNAWIKESKRIVFFGGAGVSTESGVPDFRSKDGLYNQHDVRFEQYSPEYLLSHSCLTDHPEVFFEFYRQKMDARNVKPNTAHLKLAELERVGKLSAVVTQNIDGLHQKAGSRNVYEIHGTTRRNYCVSCGKEADPDAIFLSKDPVPRCECGGMIRPDVTLYQEMLPDSAVKGAKTAIRQADMLIIGGTSLKVYPAASFVEWFRGKHTVVINHEPLDIPVDFRDDLEFNESIGKVMSEIRLEGESS